ncbi:regulatory-associated protein of mTOR-like isoform X3 [Pomacea canaliculata]|uniref:regulatory-associated protein of mTOR-like isoform X3 n=1 Tax=Pomacea canaliculata TaxID=400727 RepID=UPI000D7346BD|nr:regulatory-associated protein of mTOR-like isoform X3 [Pomacea canaliculata]
MRTTNMCDNENDYFEEDEEDLLDGQLPVVCNQNRHLQKIEGSPMITQTWRMKERMKTVSVALVLCLNIGVDPPDVVKISPCARLQCWIEPNPVNAQKFLEAIGANLQRQYERWQPKARYKQCLDPNVEEVKKLCLSLRRSAKEERVLFHYGGHGVPRPTVNGEIWVFNKSFTQYIPLSLYDLQTWMESPSIYVFDCSNAGIVAESFKAFAKQTPPERNESRSEGAHSGASVTDESTTTSSTGSSSSQQQAPFNCILLAACGKNELLPMNPELPADLFTSCLTTPVRMALRWYVLQNSNRLVPSLTLDMVEKIPGQLNDRRTMLGELNWIFTAITDTIAWYTLPRDLFHKLFRQDLLVASLFRNFLLAERIMRSYNCIPISLPKLPSTYQHSMWRAWDLALDLCLQQLPLEGEGDGAVFQHSPFFAEQLTAFQVWLTYGFEKREPPEQLPIVLQVLLSQVHRLRALDLLGKFVDLGPWAVNLALSVGIFPYVLKLLQSPARELRPPLVFIWAKIMAVDSSCQVDLVKDKGHLYFLSVLGDQYMPAEYRTMAAFVLTAIMNDYRPGQAICLKDNVIATCLEQLNDSSGELRQWLALCLAKVWTNYDNARWCGVRDSAHEKLYKLLSDPVPEVRASAVYALGTFIFNGSERSDHANSIELGVGMSLVQCAADGSPLVRKELAVAFGGLVETFEAQFVVVAARIAEEEKQKDRSSPVIVGETSGGWSLVAQAQPSGIASGSGQFLPFHPSASTTSLEPSDANAAFGQSVNLRRCSSGTSIAGGTAISLPFNNVYTSVWRSLILLAADPHPEVSKLAKEMVSFIKDRIHHPRPPPGMNIMHMSSPACLTGSPSSRPANMRHGTPPPKNLMSQSQSAVPQNPPSPAHNAMMTTGAQHSIQFPLHRKVFDKGPSQSEEKDSEEGVLRQLPSETQLFAWSCLHFVNPLMRIPADKDPESLAYHRRQFKYLRNSRVRARARYDQHRAGFNRLDDQIFVNRTSSLPSLLAFHPYENFLSVAEKDTVSIWDWEMGTRKSLFVNGHHRTSRVSSVEFMNPHDDTLLLCGSDDGAVRIWRNFESEEPGKELVTAFQAITDMLPLQKGAGLVTRWEQESSTLFCAGDVRVIRLWDMQTEARKQDIPTGADSCVTSLASDASGRSLLIAGCGDGTVRLFDRRLAPTECRVMTLREHSSWVLNVHLQRGAEGKIISASVNGDIRFWDPRFTESVRVHNTQAGFTAVDIHPRADVIACGVLGQMINVYNESGDVLSTIKYHEGFLGQRIGTISCLAFHPHLVKLAAGSTDSFISVYSTPMSKRI